MASSFLRDERGASFLEFTAVFSIVMLLTMGVVSLALVMVTWAQANRATQVGARVAATNAPVAQDISTTITGSSSSITVGTACFNPVTGVDALTCVVAPEVTCAVNSSDTGVCIDSGGVIKTFSEPAFTDIFNAMQDQFLSRELDRQQVVVKYTPLKLGYVGRTDTPMNVTVSFNCLRQGLYGLDALAGWVVQTTGCAGIPDAAGLPLGDFATTMLGEDLGRRPNEDVDPP